MTIEKKRNYVLNKKVVIEDSLIKLRKHDEYTRKQLAVLEKKILDFSIVAGKKRSVLVKKIEKYCEHKKTRLDSIFNYHTGVTESDRYCTTCGKQMG